MGTSFGSPELRDRLKRAEEAGLDAFLDSLLEEALGSVGVAEGTLMLLNQKEGVLEIVKRRSRFEADIRKKFRRFRVGDGIAGLVAERGQPYCCTNVQQDSNFKAPVDQLLFTSLLAVPILREGRTIGVICADSPEPGKFDYPHVDRLSSIARDVGPAIVDLAVETYIGHAKRLKQLDSLHDVGQILSRLTLESPQDLDHILERIAQEAWRVLDADLITLYQYNEKGSSFQTPPKTAGQFKHPEWMVARVSPEDSPARIVKAGISRYRENARADAMMHAHPIVPAGDGLPERPSFVDREGIASSAGVLLKAGIEVVGVMFVNYRTSHPLPEDEKHVIEIFGAYAALAIAGARTVTENINLQQSEALMRSAGMFVHRLRNSLPVVSDYLDRILNSPDDSERVKEASQKALEANRRAQRIIDQFERFAKAEVFDCPNRMSARDLVSRLHEIVRQSLTQRTVTVDAQVNEMAPEVQVNLDRLTDDFVAFVRDSERHRDSGLSLVILGALASEDEVRRCGLKPGRRYLRISYLDNGPGIPKALTQRIFEPFFTTTGGSGLGLYVASYNARVHGGCLVERGEPGSGVRFELYLPEAAASGEMENAAR